MKTQEQLSDRIRDVETKLIATVMGGEEASPAASKLKTEWETLLWIDGREVPPEEAHKDLTQSYFDHPGRMAPPLRRRHRAIHHHDSIQ